MMKECNSARSIRVSKARCVGRRILVLLSVIIKLWNDSLWLKSEPHKKNWAMMAAQT